MSNFYGDANEAEKLSGVIPSDTDTNIIKQNIINNIIDSEIKIDGFNIINNVEYQEINSEYCKYIMLRHIPVIVDSTFELIDNFYSAPAIINSDYYFIDTDTGKISLMTDTLISADSEYISYFTKNGIVKITYKSGFSEVPSDIARLATLMLAKWLKISDDQSDINGLSSIKIGNYSESYDKSFMAIKSEFDTFIDPLFKALKYKYNVGV